MYFVVICAFMILLLSGLFYVSARCRRFRCVQAAWRKSKVLGVLIFALPFAAFAVGAVFSIYSAAVWFLHLFFFFLLFDFFAFIARKISHRRPERYIAGALAIAVTFIYMGMGWFFAHHVFETDYTVESEKTDGVRIALIADSHIGATFDGEGFAEYVREIADKKPDMLVIAGDFIDESTSREDMENACAAFAEIDPPLGKYYVFGNHDKGLYGDRDYSVEDFCERLSASGVRILEDDVVSVGDNICVIGRRDRSDPEGRLDMRALTAAADKSKFTIVLDHQPGDYDAEAESGVDLVLSGHTHGGHIYPMGYIGTLTGENDGIYGMQHREDTDFIITSGISGWEIPFKTGAVSEYVVIDVEKVS